MKTHRIAPAGGDPENQTAPTELVGQTAQAAPVAAPLSNATGVPYRGAEQHGVAYTHGQGYQWDRQLDDDTLFPGRFRAVPETPIAVADPIDVRVVHSPATIVDRKFWAVASRVLVRGNAPEIVAGHRMERTKVRIVFRGSGRVWLMPTPDFSPANAYPLDDGSAWESETTEAVYAMLDASAAGNNGFVQESTTPLAANAVFISPTRNAAGMATFRAFGSSDAAGTLGIQQSRDGISGWFNTGSLALGGQNQGIVLDAAVVMPFVRAYIVNGPAAETVMELDTLFPQASTAFGATATLAVLSTYVTAAPNHAALAKTVK